MYTLRDIQQETEQIEKYLEIVRAPAAARAVPAQRSAGGFATAFQAGARALLLLRRCCTR